MYKNLFPDDHQPPMFPPKEESYYSPEMQEQQNHSSLQPSPPFLDIDSSVVSLSSTNSSCIQYQVSKMYLKYIHVHLTVCLYIYLKTFSLQEIFNHVLADIEFFIGKVGTALAQMDGKKKKKKKNKDKSTIIYGKLQQCGLNDLSFQHLRILLILYSYFLCRRKCSLCRGIYSLSSKN